MLTYDETDYDATLANFQDDLSKFAFIEYASYRELLMTYDTYKGKEGGIYHDTLNKLAAIFAKHVIKCFMVPASRLYMIIL